MKQLLWAVLLAMPYLLKAQVNSEEKGIRWAEGLSWEQLKQKAKEENKYLFVDAYATWCLPCKKMDKEVYTTEKVADLVNSSFVSIKVQMDETEKDNEQVKAFYPVARSLKEKYGMDGYPSFLFFSPDGKLAHRGIGYKNSENFMGLVKEALTDPVARYENDINKYKSGQLSFANMPQLARDAWDKKDKEIAIRIVKDYKKNFVDKLKKADAFTQENLSILGEFSNEVLSSKDRYFKFFKQHSEQADTIINWTLGGKLRHVANKFVLSIIRKEEITNKVYTDGKPIPNLRPNWSRIQKTIREKYGQEYVDNFFPDEQIRFYEMSKDWETYAKYVNFKIKKIPPKAGGKLFGGTFGDAWQLNWYSWRLFLGSGDKSVLEKALPWIDLSLELEERHYAIDTKANILYRLGKVSEAISLQEKAVTLSKNSAETTETLNKMKSGLPTWPE